MPGVHQSSRYPNLRLIRVEKTQAVSGFCEKIRIHTTVAD